MPTHRLRQLRGCLVAAAVLVALVAGGAVAGQAGASRLQQRIDAAKAHERALAGALAAQNGRVHQIQGTLADVNHRLALIQQSVDVERRLLNRLQARLRIARARLVFLRSALGKDRALLARQLRAAYVGGTPDIVTVILQARGFADLLERVDQMKTLARSNAKVLNRVRVERNAVRRQVARIAPLEARQERATAAVSAQRDQVAQLRLAVLSREIAAERARNAVSSRLAGLRSRRQALQDRLAEIERRAAAAQAQSFAAPITGGTGLGGGFSQAPGTNYSVGNEPEIAARLDRMGKALGIHLVGISGYRSPQHSVEVGGFANDPHTRGEASDTLGVEGVPEATLRSFGLTRPFPGPAEADHIQLCC